MPALLVFATQAFGLLASHASVAKKQKLRLRRGKQEGDKKQEGYKDEAKK
jgi:hypothetical protein